MATLEIHNGQGGVEYLTITREQPVIFGSDPKCEIVLRDPLALPYHGRLRWKSGRYKVEAFPEAQAIEVNGKKVVSASFRQGGEIRVGQARIFLITPDDGPADFEKTRVQPAPKQSAMAGWGGKLDHLHKAEVAPPSLDTNLSALEAELDDDQQEADSGWSHPATARDRKQRKPNQERKRSKRPSIRERFKTLVKPRDDQAPGEERILTSPLVIGLVTTILLLSVIGYGLYDVITQMIASNRFDAAVASFDNGEFRNALIQFEQFLENHPKDERGSRARVLMGMAQVRQFTTGANPAWSNALDEARALVADVRDEPAFPDARADIAALILDIAQGLANRARVTADEKALRDAEAAAELHDRIGGEAAEGVRARARFPERLEEARAAVTKATTRAQALAAMDQALQEEDPSGVYQARDALIARYADQVEDRQVLERLRAANALIRDAVTLDPTRRPAETDPALDPLGPPTSLVLRSSTEAASASAPIVYALAEGFAYGLDGSNGAPLWHVPVGLAAPFPPQAISGRPSALVFDARTEELVRLDGRTGELTWRQAIGEAIEAPPLILGNQIVQVTPGGNVLFLDLGSGDVRATMDLGRPLTQSPVADESGQHYYVLGMEDILYIIERESLECIAVEYLGHEPGSVPCPPARLGNYFVVPENHRPELGRWSVFVLEDEGTRLRLAQRINLPGWTWHTPSAMGSVIWAVGDFGSVEAYSIGAYNDEQPFKRIARVAPESEPLGPTFTRPRSERELWVASARSARYDLNAERGELRQVWTLGQAGPALAPIQTAGRLLVLTQQAPDGPGAALWGVDPVSGNSSWRTVLGSAWTAEPVAISSQGIATLAADGSALLLAVEDLAEGGFLQQPLPRPGERRLPLGGLQRLDGDGLTIIVPAPDADHFFARRGDSAELRRIELPARLAATPLLWGSDLLIPGDDGRVYLIDPTSGVPTTEPFIPPFDRSDPVRWLPPVLLDDDAVVLADREGRLRRLSKARSPRPRLVVSEEPPKLDRPLIAAPASTGLAVLLATDDQRLRAYSGRDLSPVGTWTLDAPLALGPLAVSGFVFAAEASGVVHTFDLDGQRLWTVELPDGPPTGPPALVDDSAWFLTRGGGLHCLSLLDGTRLEHRALDPLPAGGPLVVGDQILVPVAPGSTRLLLPDREELEIPE